VKIFFIRQAIRIGFACADELAIILCCWLLGLKLNCYIILGSTLSNGPNSAFVFISFSDGEQWIIDPTTGLIYEYLEEPVSENFRKF